MNIKQHINLKKAPDNRELSVLKIPFLPHRTYKYPSIIETDWLMHFEETITAYSSNHVKTHKYTLWAKCGVLNVEAGNRYSNSWNLKD
jgi:hypothetical protein